MSLSPQPNLTEAEREAGVRRIVMESGYAAAGGAVTSGVILTAFALQLGASNGMIGLLAAIPFLTQPLQAPAILLVERLRTRKRISVMSSVIGRSALLCVAALAFLPGDIALPLLLLLQVVYCGMGAVGSCAWNAWIRDLLPEGRMGVVVSRRSLYATIANLVAGLAAALALDRAQSAESGRAAVFAVLYVFGAAGGLISAGIVSGIPEPAMAKPQQSVKLRALLSAPFRDANFRRLIAFLAAWQFAANLATPFFTVFMVKQLGFSMTFVMAVTIASQIANVAVVSSWGLLSDRFSNKSVLGVCAPLYILCIAAMIGASQLADRPHAAAYLIALHIVMGMAAGGVTLATANIALKLSPRGAATAYVAASAMASSVAAGLAPVLGGLFADFFAQRRLDLLLRLTRPDGVVQLSPLSIAGWDFYFLGAAVLGLFALHRLALVREEGEAPRSAVIAHIVSESGRMVRSLSSVAGLRAMTAFPGGLLHEMQTQKRRRRVRPS
jgi:MFS family permease